MIKANIVTGLADQAEAAYAGSDSDDIESLVYLLKRHVDSLLLFHLGNSFGFATRAEAARFMDLPPNRDEIDLRISRLRSARKFVSGGANQR